MVDCLPGVVNKMAGVLQIKESWEIPSGVAFNKGVWTVSFKSQYLGSYINYDDACMVRWWMENNCEGVHKDQVKARFLDAVKGNLIDRPLKQGSSNTRKPRGISQINKKTVSK